MLENKFAQFIVIFSITQTHIQSSIQIKMRQIILLVEQIIITDDDNDDLCVPLSFATETGKDIIFYMSLHLIIIRLFLLSDRTPSTSTAGNQIIYIYEIFNFNMSNTVTDCATETTNQWVWPRY